MLHKHIPADGVELIEIKIDIAKAKYNFDFSSILHNKNIMYLERVEAQTYIKSPSDREIASNIPFIILVNNKKEFINRLLTSRLTKKYIHFPIINSIVDWPNSYLEFPTLPSSDVGKSICYLVYYTYKQKMPTDNFSLNTGIESVELIIKNTSERKFYFDDNVKLRDKKIYFIEYIYVNSPNGYAVPGVVYYKAYITLRDKKGRDIISRLPVSSLLYYSGDYFRIIEFEGVEVDWRNSFVEFANTDSLVENSSLFFQMYYKEENKQKFPPRKEIKRKR